MLTHMHIYIHKHRHKSIYIINQRGRGVSGIHGGLRACCKWDKRQKNMRYHVHIIIHHTGIVRLARETHLHCVRLTKTIAASATSQISQQKSVNVAMQKCYHFSSLLGCNKVSFTKSRSSHSKTYIDCLWHTPKIIKQSSLVNSSQSKIVLSSLSFNSKDPWHPPKPFERNLLVLETQLPRASPATISTFFVSGSTGVTICPTQTMHD